MNTTNMKKDIDVFIRDMFHGFSTLLIANATHDKLPMMVALIDVKLGEFGSIVKILETLMADLRTYMDKESDDQLTHKIYSAIIALRMIGVIVNNNDSISSLKMEKLQLEDKAHKFEKDNELLAEQLANCRNLLDTKKIDFKAVG